MRGSRLGFPDMGPVIIQSIQVPTRRRRLACRAVVPIKKRSARIVGAGRWVHCCLSNTSACGEDGGGRGIVSGTRITVVGVEPVAPPRGTTRHTRRCIHPNC